MSSNTSRFFKLELGEAEKQVEGLVDETGKAIVGADGKIHVAERLATLPGLKGTTEGCAILEEVAAGYDFTPPPIEREMMLRELRARIWVEEDRKQAERLAGRNPMPKWNGVDKNPDAKIAAREGKIFTPRKKSWWRKLLGR